MSLVQTTLRIRYDKDLLREESRRAPTSPPQGSMGSPAREGEDKTRKEKRQQLKEKKEKAKKEKAEKEKEKKEKEKKEKEKRGRESIAGAIKSVIPPCSCTFAPPSILQTTDGW